MARYSAAPKEDMDAFLELVRKGHSFRDAIFQLGYTNGCYNRWKERDKEFAKALDDARQVGIGAMENKIHNVIFDDRIEWNGAKSNLAMFALKQRDPSYRESAPPVQFNLNVEHKSIDMKEVRKILEDSGAMDVIEGSYTEDHADDQRTLPAAGEVHATRPGKQS